MSFFSSSSSSSDVYEFHEFWNRFPHPCREPHVGLVCAQTGKYESSDHESALMLICCTQLQQFRRTEFHQQRQITHEISELDILHGQRICSRPRTRRWYHRCRCIREQGWLKKRFFLKKETWHQPCFFKELCFFKGFRSRKIP